jgi:hypothetical protein
MKSICCSLVDISSVDGDAARTGRHVRIKVDSTVGKLAERSLLLKLCIAVSHPPHQLPLFQIPAVAFNSPATIIFSVERSAGRRNRIVERDCKGIGAYRQPPRRSTSLLAGAQLAYWTEKTYVVLGISHVCGCRSSWAEDFDMSRG